MAAPSPARSQGLLLLRGGRVYSPSDLGRQDLLIAGGKIVAMEPSIDVPDHLPFVTRVDATDRLVLPGFIDGHVHILGGGGEGGPETRAFEILPSQITAEGVTTVVSCLGLDCESRSLQGLLAKARALQVVGVSAYLLTGGFILPVRTLTGSVTTDIAFITEIIGVGEVAIADHRSSQPSFDDLAKIAAAAHMGGLLGKKTGIFVLHVGDGPAGLSQLLRLTKETELASTQFLPTHINRNHNLFAQAIEYARAGGFVDVTTCMAPALGFPESLQASRAITELVKAGVDPSNITMTSDGSGNKPVLDLRGQVVGLSALSLSTLYQEFRALVLEQGMALEQAVRFVTSNPARILGLTGKGGLTVGADADLLLVDPDLSIQAVYARGQVMVSKGEPTKGAACEMRIVNESPMRAARPARGEPS